MEKSFWQKISLGFKPSFYKEIIFPTSKQGFKFLALFLLFLALFLTFKSSYNLYKFSQELIRNSPVFFERLRDLPEIKIEKGEVILPKEKFVKEWGSFSLTINREGEIPSYLEKSEKTNLVLLRKQAIWKTPQKTEIYDLSGINYFNFRFNQANFPVVELNGKTLQLTTEGMKSFANCLVPLISPFLLIFTFFALFVGKSIQIFLFSLLSLIINKVKKLKLTYSNILNIGIFALIPALIFETIIKLINLKIPYFGLVYSIIYLVFLIPGLLKFRIKPQPLSQ